MAKKHFLVGGQCRDYDYTTFCEDCWPACLEFMQNWLEELADGCDEGQTVKIEFTVKQGECEFCSNCGKANCEDESVCGISS